MDHQRLWWGGLGQKWDKNLDLSTCKQQIAKEKKMNWKSLPDPPPPAQRSLMVHP